MLLALGGCIPAQVRELSSLEGKMLNAYVGSATTALDNNIKIHEARFKQGRITEAERDQLIASIKAVKEQGEVLKKSHKALDKWIQTEGPAEGVRDAVTDILPLIPTVVDMVKGDD